MTTSQQMNTSPAQPPKRSPQQRVVGPRSDEIVDFAASFRVTESPYVLLLLGVEFGIVVVKTVGIE